MRGMSVSDSAAWDPVTALTESDRVSFKNRWPELCPLNVPGPFYTGQTDNCWTGRLHAPDYIMYGGEYFAEYVYRQPRDAAGVAAVVTAAGQDPCCGYGCDGDAHWTPEAVRAWWRDRDEVRLSVNATLAELQAENREEYEEAALGALAYLAYLDDGLEEDLRRYLFRLEEGRYPLDGDALPHL